MEKHYEMPKVQVVRYRKRVKTDTEFTDSSGVQQIGLRCEFCNKMIFAVRADEYWACAPGEAYNRWYAALIAAEKAHFKECPNLPPDFGF